MSPRQTGWRIAGASLGLWLAVGGKSAAQNVRVGAATTVRPAVEFDAGGRQSWSAAERDQPLSVTDSLRTSRSGSAIVGFVDNSWCKLSEGLTLTVRDPATLQIGKSADTSRAALLCSSNGPRQLRTLAAAVEIRGTEFVLEVFDDRTVLTVVEGSALLSTSIGSVIVNASEEGTARPGEAPTKRTLLNPDDAVQWALNYPTDFPDADRPLGTVSGQVRSAYAALAAGDVTTAVSAFQTALATPLLEPERAWARIGLSSSYQQMNRVLEAQQVLDEPFPAGMDAEGRAQRAAVALDLGDVGRAREEIELALAADPRATRPLVLLATVELTQNHKAEARDAVDRALAAQPASLAANKTASEVAQAYFELDRALEYVDRALSRDPRYVPALINRARLRFGTGDIVSAKRDAAFAATIAPNDPLVRSLLGFIDLADADLSAAERQFAAANATSARFGEPHLGLGLVRFQQGRTEDGLAHFRDAAAAEPRVSLYQSYLAKAYYQVRRFNDGLKALEAAKRLDPLDPTPWLYESFLLRDQNRQVDALRALHEATARNGNRAVYRSRLLLDRDLAVGSVSLAEVYRQLGFESFAAAEATDSLDLDISNASAHLFLSGSFLSQGDRLQAGSSEMLQYLLYTPVNRNTFFTASPVIGFNEYTTLIDSPWRQLSLEGTFGDRTVTAATSRSGNRRFAHLAFIDDDRERGARRGRADRLTTALVQGKVAFRSATDVFFQVNASDADRGDQEEEAITVNASRFDPFIHIRRVDERNRVNTLTSTTVQGISGLRHEWFLGSTLTAAFQVSDRDPVSTMPTAIDLRSGGQLRLRSVIERPERSFNAQVQQVMRAGRQQFTVGVEAHRSDRSTTGRLLLDEPDFEELAAQTTKGRDRDTTAWLRADLRLWPRTHITAGTRYSDSRYFEPAADATFESARWQPMVGLSFDVRPDVVVRAAAFRQVNSNFLGSRISPTTIEGFVLDRNDLPASVRDELNLSFERRRWNAFHAVHGYRQRVQSRLADVIDVAEPSRRSGVTYRVNRVLAKRWTLFAANELAHTGSSRRGTLQLLPIIVRVSLGFDTSKDQYVRWDNHLQAGVNFIHERGWLVRVRHTNLIQRFGGSPVPEFEDAVYNATDVDVAYELADKRVSARVQLRNVADLRFIPFVDTFRFGLPEVRRRVSATIRWRF